MIKHLKKYLFCFLLSPFATFGQSALMDSLTKWDDVPKLHTPNSEEAKEPDFWVYSNSVVLYSYKNDGYPILNSVLHKIIHINESKSIEEYNKVYIPVEEESDMENFKARTITAGGKIINVKRSDVKLITEEGRNYLTVAVEGLEVGGEMEYVYSLKKSLTFLGTTYIQSSVYSRESFFSIISPENLVMKSKLYNSNSTPVDTVIDNWRYVNYSFKNVVPQQEEKYSGENADLIRVEYKLEKNTIRKEYNMNSYADVGKNYYAAITSLEKNESKEIEKLYQKMKLDGKSDEEKIRGMEGYVKTNFRYDKNTNIQDMAQAIKGAIVNEYFCNKVFINLLEFAQIKYEAVATISRFKKKFDPDFESETFLDNILIYFPSLDKYVVPNDYSQRLGSPGFTYCGNYGLFIKAVKIGDVATATSSIKKIKEQTYGSTYEDMQMEVSFSSDLKKVKTHTLRSLKGDVAKGIRPVYFYVEDDKKKEVADELLKMSIEGATVSNSKVSNFDINTAQVDLPFTIEGDAEFSSVLESAEGVIIFKVGALIGPQVEIYQEKPRQSPIEVEFPHYLDRKIVINIPAGYEPKGLDALNMNVFGGDAKNFDFGFESTYAMNGNQLVVTIHEYYKKVNYPIEEYAKFRDVINASADFNKVSFVLEKK